MFQPHFAFECRKEKGAILQFQNSKVILVCMFSPGFCWKSKKSVGIDGVNIGLEVLINDDVSRVKEIDFSVKWTFEWRVVFSGL